MTNIRSLRTTLLAAGAVCAFVVVPAQAEIGACLITKTDTNPFFVKMKEGAIKGAEAAGITLQTFAGKN